MEKISDATTVRIHTCEVLIDDDGSLTCANCKRYRKTLGIFQSRLKDLDRSEVSLNRPHSSLSKKQLLEKLSQVTKEKKYAIKRCKVLEKMIEKVMKKDSCHHDEESHIL